VSQFENVSLICGTFISNGLHRFFSGREKAVASGGSTLSQKKKMKAAFKTQKSGGAGRCKA
jgi:hypothetical protein